MTHDVNSLALSRREALIGSSAAAGIAAALASSPASARAYSSLSHPTRFTSEFLQFGPVEHFRQSMRLQRSMRDEDEILHWYHFIMFSVPVGKSPQPVVRFEGIELSHHRRVSKNAYVIHGHNLSFPRDLLTGKFTDRAMNPVTGKWVTPETMALTQDPGYLVSPRGQVALNGLNEEPRMKYGMIRREGRDGGFVKIDGIRVAPPNWPATFVETGYESAPAELFDDPAQLWLPTEVSGAYVFPWPAWMQMGDAPGHMFAAWSGYKLHGIGELPEEFYKRAKKERPDLLQVDLKQFGSPIVLPNWAKA